MLLTVFEHLDRFAPSKLLPVIDLAQVQDMALHHAPAQRSSCNSRHKLSVSQLAPH
jgi:hypothetical protein